MTKPFIYDVPLTDTTQYEAQIAQSLFFYCNKTILFLHENSRRVRGKKNRCSVYE